MSTTDTTGAMEPKPVWEGEELTPDVANGMDVVMARVYALTAWHAATRTRSTYTALGEVEDEDDVPIGAEEAKQVVTELHELGLLRVANRKNAKLDTPLVFRLSRTSPPPHMPRHLRFAPDRVKVGGRFTAPKNLDRPLLKELLATGKGINKLNEVPGSERDSGWVTALADMTERRAAAFRQWATIDASRVVEEEATRLAVATGTIREQAANRLAAEVKRRGGRNTP